MFALLGLRAYSTSESLSSHRSSFLQVLLPIACLQEPETPTLGVIELREVCAPTKPSSFPSSCDPFLINFRSHLNLMIATMVRIAHASIFYNLVNRLSRSAFKQSVPALMKGFEQNFAFSAIHMLFYAPFWHLIWDPPTPPIFPQSNQPS